MNLAGGKIELKMTNMVFGPPQCSIQVIHLSDLSTHLYLEIMAKELSYPPTQICKGLNLQMMTIKTEKEFLQLDYHQ